MTEHTPGPWYLHNDDEIHGDNGDIMVCRMSRTGNGWNANPIHTPDARLIAAAPDMLAALRRYVEADQGRLEFGPDINEQAYEAIAKAEGD